MRIDEIIQPRKNNTLLDEAFNDGSDETFVQKVVNYFTGKKKNVPQQYTDTVGSPSLPPLPTQEPPPPKPQPQPTPPKPQPQPTPPKPQPQPSPSPLQKSKPRNPNETQEERIDRIITEMPDNINTRMYKKGIIKFVEDQNTKTLSQNKNNVFYNNEYMKSLSDEQIKQIIDSAGNNYIKYLLGESDFSKNLKFTATGFPGDDYRHAQEIKELIKGIPSGSSISYDIDDKFDTQQGIGNSNGQASGDKQTFKTDYSEKHSIDWKSILKTTIEKVEDSKQHQRSYSRSSRRRDDPDLVIPGRVKRTAKNDGNRLDIAVAIDQSGSISENQKRRYLNLVRNVMETYATSGFNLYVMLFDTEIHNPVKFTENNIDQIDKYEVSSVGGGTDASVIFRYLKQNKIKPKQLLIFGDGDMSGRYKPDDSTYCPTVWIIDYGMTDGRAFYDMMVADGHWKAPFGRMAYGGK